jgi:hypothetical protein
MRSNWDQGSEHKSEIENNLKKLKRNPKTLLVSCECDTREGLTRGMTNDSQQGYHEWEPKINKKLGIHNTAIRRSPSIPCRQTTATDRTESWTTESRQGLTKENKKKKKNRNTTVGRQVAEKERDLTRQTRHSRSREDPRTS